MWGRLQRKRVPIAKCSFTSCFQNIIIMNLKLPESKSNGALLKNVNMPETYLCILFGQKTLIRLIDLLNDTGSLGTISSIKRHTRYTYCSSNYLHVICNYCWEIRPRGHPTTGKSDHGVSPSSS